MAAIVDEIYYSKIKYIEKCVKHGIKIIMQNILTNISKAGTF